MRWQAQQIGGGVVSRGTAEGDGVLAGHRGEIPGVVRGGVGDIAGRIDIGQSLHAKIFCHMQTSKAIALAGNLIRKHMGAHAGSPDHGARTDAFAAVEHEAMRGTTSPYVTPLRPDLPSRASGWAYHALAMRLPVLPRSSSFMHAVVNTPAESQGAISRSLPPR